MLPRHTCSDNCNCNDKDIWRKERTRECRWLAVERDSACGWAIRIYQKLKTDLETKKLTLWYFGTLKTCNRCTVDRGCCKKRKLTLAMTLQILDWLKLHQGELNGAQTWKERILVYRR